MKMSKYYVPTLKEVPAEAELISHQLLLRAGMIRKLASGVYTYLPLAVKVLKNIEEIVREEMDAIDSQECLMSALCPSELWKETGRWDDFGPEMFRLHDRHNREFCLGPTHEEVFTNLIRHELKSYKQLPLSLYQIQTKYRDEKRPRFGLMRGREFTMKDAYTFDRDEEGMRKSYFEMWGAYENIFNRCSLDFKVVEGDSGAMGGSDSHEFIALSDVGETEIVFCNSCDYAATDEKAACSYKIESDEDVKTIEKVHTPDVKTIDELESFFNVSKNNFIKTLLYTAGEETVAVLIPGDRELNEVKLLKHLDVLAHDLEIAAPEVVKEVTSAEVGFAGPIGLKEGVRVLIDERIPMMRNAIIGANETDYHLKNANFDTDFTGEVVGDLIMAKAGDLCPKCGDAMSVERGNEVGNIFQLGTKYSKALNATFLDENGKEQLILMGSHGVGVSRTLAAIIEQHHDEHGIIWPLSVAPYHVIITVVNSKKEDQQALGLELYETLKSAGIKVILDDRKERAGVKFADAELIGIPLRVNVGRDASESLVEFKLRSGGETEVISSNDVLNKVQELLK
ncbi:proline--tRNA ligase [Acidaminobacter sp. JC074]|uniref:proline--tRNA ligase n=1 Tax=Acidaminobacter sp. JC074 TaxID=2530199 RepID=UPI001F0D6D49|nr:proline--tRNA ligase [Acidaminobacter sp. JC074]MCH4890841.1 proline--tRNA ligase [Acidaminobacter sp. JC074]